MAGVSLLKPLKGVDPNLISNLETFFTLDYPKVRSAQSPTWLHHVTSACSYLSPRCVFSNRCVCLQYEILLCVQDQDDPAVDVCKKLLGKYPNVDARLFIGELPAVCLLLVYQS